MSTAAANADSAALQQEIMLLRGENKTLRDQLAWFKRKVFGPGCSETLDRAQQLIALDAATVPAPERPVETITYQREKGPRAPRPTPAETFAHLPVKETIVIVPDEVQAEPEAFEQIGEERTFEVDIVAPQLFRREIVRPKFRRKADRSQPPSSRPRRCGPWSAVTPPPACSRGSSSPSSSTTSRSTVRKRC